MKNSFRKSMRGYVWNDSEQHIIDTAGYLAKKPIWDSVEGIAGISLETLLKQELLFEAQFESTVFRRVTLSGFRLANEKLV